MSVKIHAMPPSPNQVGPVVFVKHVGCGDLAFCDMMSGAHKTEAITKFNPMGQLPTMEDGDFGIGESVSIFRYLATKYAPEFYGPSPEEKAVADWACDLFQTSMYQAICLNLFYPVNGWAAAPEDQAAANAKALEMLAKFHDMFLKGKGPLVGGAKPSIADFKIAPFLVAVNSTGVKEMTGFEAPGWIATYLDAFKAAVPTAAMLYEADGFAVDEFLNANAKKAAQKKSQPRGSLLEAGL